MSNLTIAWILLTWPVMGILGVLYKKYTNIEKLTYGVDLIMIDEFLLWWGIYFLIK